MLSHRKASEGDAVRLLSDGSGEGKKVGKGRGILVGFIGWLPQQTPHYPAPGARSWSLQFSHLFVSSLVGDGE